MAGLREWFRFRDFSHFIQAYSLASQSVATADDYELIAFEYAQELARQNCRYAEIGFTPSYHRRKGVPHDVSFGGLTRARERARKELGVEIAWNFDVSRRMGGSDAETFRWAEYTVDVAIESMGDGLVALGLAGPEEGCPPELYARYFDRARAAGLHSYPHAGEHAGPESVRGALDSLGAERIAHGVRAVEDPALVEGDRGARHRLRRLPHQQRLPRRRPEPRRAPAAEASGGRRQGHHRLGRPADVQHDPQ